MVIPSGKPVYTIMCKKTEQGIRSLLLLTSVDQTVDQTAAMSLKPHQNTSPKRKAM